MKLNNGVKLFLLILALVFLTALPASAALNNIKLNDTITDDDDGWVLNFKISPDGSRVIFQSKVHWSVPNQLYTVPIGGGTVVKLNPDLATGSPTGVQIPFYITPDGQYVLYTADPEEADRVEVYRSPIDGSASATKLSALSTGESVGDFVLSEDGSMIVYQVVRSLYSVPVDGSSAPVHLTSSANSKVQLSPDGQWVVYRDGSGTVGSFYSVPTDGSAAPVQLNNEPPTSGSINMWSYLISSDSQWVVYFGEQNRDYVDELYSVPIDRSAEPARLNFSDEEVEEDFLLGPDDNWVYFRATQSIPYSLNLYRAPIDGSADPTPLFTGSPNEFILSPDGNRLAYTADDANDDAELYSLPSSGGTPVKLDGPFTGSGQDPKVFKFSPDSRWLGYVIYEGVFNIPATGGSRIQISTDGQTDIRDFIFTENSQRMLYRTKPFGPPKELYGATVSGLGPVKLNGELVSEYVSGVSLYAATANGEKVVYTADQDTSSIPELYASDFGVDSYPAYLPMFMKN